MKKIIYLLLLVVAISISGVSAEASSSSKKSRSKSQVSASSSSFNIKSLLSKNGRFWHLKSESNLLHTLKDLGFSTVNNIYNASGQQLMEDENGNKIIPKIIGAEGIKNPQFTIKHLQKDSINVYLIYFFSDLSSIEIIFPKAADLKAFIKSATDLHFKRIEDSYFLSPLSITITGQRTISICEDENPY